jgi:hypothetical protein
VQEPDNHEPALAGLALRLFWMLFGHGIVFTSLVIIVVDELAYPAILDGVVWLTVVLMIAARRVDITRWRGTTASGEPATLAHWRRYSLALVGVTSAVFLVAHALGR